MVVDPPAAPGAVFPRLLCWPTALALTFVIGAALTVALPQPAPRSLVGAFAAGETLFAVGLVLIVIGIGIQVWLQPVRPSARRRSLAGLVDDAAASGLVLLGLALNAVGAGLHPAILLVAGRPPGDDALLLADLGAGLLVYAPLALLMLGRRRANRPARPAA
jgi:uncharacterized membrane protein